MMETWPTDLYADNVSDAVLMGEDYVWATQLREQRLPRSRPVSRWIGVAVVAVAIALSPIVGIGLASLVM